MNRCIAGQKMIQHSKAMFLLIGPQKHSKNTSRHIDKQEKSLVSNMITIKKNRSKNKHYCISYNKINFTTNNS